MKDELIKLWTEYLYALNEHQQSDTTHRDGWIQHIANFNDFIFWLEKGIINC